MHKHTISDDARLHHLIGEMIPTLDEPLVDGKPISRVYTEESFEEARQKYRARALGAYDTNVLGGTNLAALTLRMKRFENKLKTEEFDPVPFEGAEYEQVVAILKLEGEIYYGEYTWRGTGGNKPNDPRFDAELAPETCEETKARESFIVALSGFCRAAAAKARDLGAVNAQNDFIEAFTALDTNYGRDPDEGFTAEEAEAIVKFVADGSRLLWGQSQALRVQRGEILSDEMEKKTLDHICEVIVAIEQTVDSAIEKLRNENNRKAELDLINKTMVDVWILLTDRFVPLAREYAKNEEATIYDETRIGLALSHLCEFRFPDDEIELSVCKGYIEKFEDSIRHPFDHHHPEIYPLHDDNGKLQTYVSAPLDDLIRYVGRPETKVPKTLKNDADVHKRLSAHRYLCGLIVDALHYHAIELKNQLLKLDSQCKKPPLAPPSINALTDHINAFSLRLTRENGDSGPWLPRTEEGKIINPYTPRQIRRAVENALGMTLAAIAEKYANSRQDAVTKMAEGHNLPEKSEFDKLNDKDGDVENGGKTPQNRRPASIRKLSKTEHFRHCQLQRNALYRDEKVMKYWAGLYTEQFILQQKREGLTEQTALFDQIMTTVGLRTK